MRLVFSSFCRYTLFLVVGFLLFALGACRSARSSLRSSEQSVTHQSASIRVLQDTLIFRDSVFIEAKGCTIRTKEVKHQYHLIRELAHDSVRDTLYRTIQKTEVRERIVQKRGFVYNIGIACIAIVAIFMLYSIKRYFSKK